MPHDVCIVHIEDEFHQMGYLPTRMRQYVQQYLSERAGPDAYVYTRLDEVASGGDENAEWVVYEIGCPSGLPVTIRYIFTATRQVPPEVVGFIGPRPYFIIDVLRPKRDRQGLCSTAEESILSALAHGGNLGTTTLYTACQGSDLDDILEKYPEIGIISKINMNELNQLICKIVVSGLGNEESAISA